MSISEDPTVSPAELLAFIRDNVTPVRNRAWNEARVLLEAGPLSLVGDDLRRHDQRFGRLMATIDTCDDVARRLTELVDTVLTGQHGLTVVPSSPSSAGPTA